MRSPSYPFINLPKAVEYIELLYTREHRNITASEVVAKHLGLSARSGSGTKILSALKKFGLLRKEGRKYGVSEIALDILTLPPGHAKSKAARRKAVLQPKIYRELWEKYNQKLPSDETLAYELEREHEFNPRTIDDFIRNFRRTLEYGELIGKEASSEISSEHDERRPKSEDTHENVSGQLGELLAPLETPSSNVLEVGLQERIHELPIPLIGGRMALLKVPIPMSEENFTLLTTILQTMKPAIVSTKD